MDAEGSGPGADRFNPVVRRKRPRNQSSQESTILYSNYLSQTAGTIRFPYATSDRWTDTEPHGNYNQVDRKPARKWKEDDKSTPTPHREMSDKWLERPVKRFRNQCIYSKFYLLHRQRRQ